MSCNIICHKCLEPKPRHEFPGGMNRRSVIWCFKCIGIDTGKRMRKLLKKLKRYACKTKFAGGAHAQDSKL